MDIVPSILGFAKELAVPLIVFGALVAYSVIRGQRPLTGLILSLYLALLLSLEFPYYTQLSEKLTFMSDAALKVSLFALFTAVMTLLSEKLLSRLLDETVTEGIGKKVILAFLGTVLIMAYSYHVLPIAGFVDPNGVIANFFGPQEYFFWWLTLPLIGLFFVT